MRKFWGKVALGAFLMLASFAAGAVHGEAIFSVYEDEIDQDAIPVIAIPGEDGEILLLVTYQAPSIGFLVKKTNGFPFGLNFDGHLLEVRGSEQRDKVKIGGGDYEGDSIGWVTPAYRTFDANKVWVLSGDKIHIRVAGEGAWSFDISDPASRKAIEDFRNACGALFLKDLAPKASRLEEEVGTKTPGGYALDDAKTWFAELNRRPSRSSINAKARAGARIRGYEGDDKAWYFEQFTLAVEQMLNGRPSRN